MIFDNTHRIGNTKLRVDAKEHVRNESEATDNSWFVNKWLLNNWWLNDDLLEWKHLWAHKEQWKMFNLHSLLTTFYYNHTQNSHNIECACAPSSCVQLWCETSGGLWKWWPWYLDTRQRPKIFAVRISDSDSHGFQTLYQPK